MSVDQFFRGSDDSHTPARTSTGVRGLDEVLGGGLPSGKLTLVTGGPGSGKTIFALGFLVRGALSGRPGIYVTFEERAESLRSNAESLGWDTRRLEEQGKLIIIEALSDHQAVVAGDFNLLGLLSIVAGHADTMAVQNVVIDAIDVILRHLNDPFREQNELYSLHSWLLARDYTTVLTTKENLDTTEGSHYSLLEYMSDCVIRMDQRIKDQMRTRRIRTVKYRGAGHGGNEYPFVIDSGGIAFLPLSAAELEHAPLGEHISTGLPRLDELLDGGYRRVSSVSISGAAGTGKTSLASSFAAAACGRGEKVLFIDFEESEQSLLECMRGIGINLRPYIDAGLLQIQTGMPESRGVEEHLIRGLAAMDDLGPDHVVVDAVSACARMGSPDAVFAYLIRLTSECKRRQITSLFVSQTRTGSSPDSPYAMGVSSVIDAILHLSYRIDEVGLSRRLLVVKARGTAHSHRYHEFHITGSGIVIDEGTPKASSND